ncbi:MAG TPA: cation diffusion facilitator family transporter [Sandaracinaceae bacterium]
MAAEADSAKVVIAAMIGNGLIAASKFGAGFLTGSASMIAEAVHSVADTANQALLMIGLRRSRGKPTQMHPFGMAAESYFWPFLVSILIFFVGGVFALYEGAHALMGEAEPEADGASTLWNYGVLGAATLFEAYSFTVAIREFRKMKGSASTMEVIKTTKDPTIPVVLMEDAAAMLGLLIALAAVTLGDLTGWDGWDGVGSLAIGALLSGVAYLLARETHSLLLGETASKEDRRKVVEIVEADAAVLRVTQLLSMHRGPEDVLLALKVGFDPKLSVEQLEAAIDRIEEAIRTGVPRMKHIFIEPDADYDPALDPERPGGLASPPRAAE